MGTSSTLFAHCGEVFEVIQPFHQMNKKETNDKESDSSSNTQKKGDHTKSDYSVCLKYPVISKTL